MKKCLFNKKVIEMEIHWIEQNQQAEWYPELE